MVIFHCYVNVCQRLEVVILVIEGSSLEIEAAAWESQMTPAQYHATSGCCG